MRRRLAAATAGALLATLLSGCFSAPPQIVTLDPNHGSTSVPADAPVRVVFDKTVLPTSVVGRFSVSPAIPGCDLSAAFRAPSTAPCWILWLPGDTGFVLFHEKAVFAPLTRYVFTLGGGFSDPAGDRNGLDHHWDLTSAAAPRVDATTPGNGAAAVAVDAPLAIAFSASMDATSTANAITLSPRVTGTRILQNVSDHSRFVILPGRLLQPGTPYTINVGPGARGEDNQLLAAASATSVHFTTGASVSLTHAAVLAAVPGESPSVVALPALAPAAAGEPAAAPVVFSAPRCAAATTCDGTPAGAPLQTLSVAEVSGDGAHLAVVAYGAGGGTASEELEVLDLVHEVVEARFEGALQPSWSPSGAQLAFTSGADVVVFDASDGARTTVSRSTPLLRPPLWAGTSSLVLSVAAEAGRAAGVTVIDLALDAQYALPGAPAGATADAATPNADEVALSDPDGSVSVLPLRGSTPPAEVAVPMRPVGFGADGTLLALSFGTDHPGLLRVSLVGGDIGAIALPPSADLATVSLAAAARRIVFLGFDSRGILQAEAANADGSGATPLTSFAAGILEAVAVDVAA
ncbi:MAG: Ig-like domain-containing protein [Candidatus Dormibacteria bacterium]